MNGQSVATTEHGCEHCGETFWARHPRQRFCSQQCSKESRGKHRICPRCGEEFLATQEHRTFTRKYCSRRCTGAALREKAAQSYPSREEVVRLYQDEELSDRELGRRFGHSYQWSLNVRRHYGIPGRRDVGFHTRTVPLAKRKEPARWHIRMKREEFCRCCGRADGGSGGCLQLHHAIPRSMSKAAKYDLRNGLPLCVACHMAWHRRALTIYRDVFTSEEWAFVCAVELLGQNISAWLDDRYPDRGRPFRNGEQLSLRAEHREAA